MALSDLQNVLQAQANANNRLDLHEDMLLASSGLPVFDPEENGFDAFVTDWLKIKDNITLSNVSASNINMDGNELTVNHATINLFRNLRLIIRELRFFQFEHEGEQYLGILLNVVLPTDWKLERDFPMLWGVPDENLMTINNAHYIFTNTTKAGYQVDSNRNVIDLLPGLNLSAALDINGFELLKEFFVFAGKNGFSGGGLWINGLVYPNLLAIDNDTGIIENIDFPYLDLRTSTLFNDSLTYGGLLKNILSVPQRPFFGLWSSLVGSGNTEEYNPGYYLGFYLDLGQQKVLECHVSMVPGWHVYSLEMAPSEVPITISDLPAVIPIFSEIQSRDYIPDFVSQLFNSIRFYGISMRFMLGDTNAVTSISTSIGTGRWVLFPGITDEIVIESIQLTWNANNPTASVNRENYVYFMADFSIHGYTFEVGISSEQVISGAAKGDISMANLLGGTFDAAGIEVPAFDADIVFTELYIDVDVPNKNYRFGAQTHVEVAFLNFAISDLLLDMEVQIPSVSGGVTQYTATMSGILSIAQSYYINLSASYAASVWNFSGNTGPHQYLPIGNMIDHITRVPEAIKSLSFYDLSVDFNLPTTHFDFRGDVNFVINGKAVTMGLQIALNNTGEASGSSFSGTVHVENILDFDLVFSTSLGVSEFTATYTGSDAFNLETLLTAFGLATDKIPHFIKTLALTDMALTYAPASKDFSLQGTLIFDPGKLHIDVQLLHQEDGTPTQTFGGRLELGGGMAFDLAFSKTSGDSYFIGSYQNPDGGKRSLRDIDGDLPDVNVGIQNALFAQHSGKKLFGIEMENGINLAGLPLVGDLFTGTAKIAYQLQWASAGGFSSRETTTINALLPAGMPPFKDTIPAGFGIATQLMLDGVSIDFDLPLTADASATGDQSPIQQGTGGIAASGRDVISQGDIHWIDIKRNFGPVHIARIGARLNGANLWFYLDAALEAGGLTIALDGLGAGSPLTDFSPSFSLAGLGIDYQQGPLEVGAHFLRQQVTENGVTFDEYLGRAIIKTEKLAIAATGAYTQYEGEPSMFIYAFLDYPLGGPPFFFVEGLALGFGYNRALRMPALENLRRYPLVQEALGTIQPGAGVKEELQRIAALVPVAMGEYFIAVGVKFTSFKMLDSFALLTVSFGERFRIDVLGTASLKVPLEGRTVVEADLNLEGHFDPEEGFLGIRALLDKNTSFILSRDCHLQGGFAFYSWFSGEHEGDFVLTLGGYHPRFTVPAHYPRVPRLSFNWQVDRHLSLTGDMYYALAPHVLMAGGHLRADYRNGRIHAWFDAGADMLIYWQPVRYDLTAHVHIGAKYRWFKIHVGADLHIWGPDFSGKARVHVWVVSFTIRFGAGASNQVQPISWDAFKTTLLPAPTQCIDVNATQGLVRQMKDTGRFIVNPKNLEVTTGSLIPVSSIAQLRGSDYVYPDFHIAPISDPPQRADATLDISLRRDGTVEDIRDQFALTLLHKNYPAAMWGDKFRIGETDSRMVSGLVSGVRIIPKSPPIVSETHTIDRQNLNYDTDANAGAYVSTDLHSQQAIAGEEDLLESLENSKAVRDSTLESLGFDTREFSLSHIAEEGDYFLHVPTVVQKTA